MVGAMRGTPSARFPAVKSKKCKKKKKAGEQSEKKTSRHGCSSFAQEPLIAGRGLC